ncbi:Transposase and inactivated derivatives [Hahella chejuensis KCTC 2396]|uniref:Transposase and inactivated derivatives n=1 Tax=Hahella chejuensis (strain KCTC 2396) TaxID=349521 RepID=Q2SMR7_HAHCH|nr:helix-turn-helix domain-containing protein [Hahella chejuensis]ABC27506.1 Transposase and inactivated derivatives [Hahella chejuensis KCTC 2396]ABC27736.1 Transposase and inactivated derivatives [Hahella chejuensis KCTC 2396]ABC28057.1 Transposase and inactivated derivatives [Hahella chejuensis KCTC 2396]ABC33028.1 Transposase and inactivated derivatives [Hahella chejuensis KCTC 2396]
MKYVNHLKPAEIKTLTDGFRYSPSSRFRIRCHAILLSNKGYKIDKIADIIDFHRNTISIWIEQWESMGICGLISDASPGRPPIYTEQEQEKVCKWIDEQPQQLRDVQIRLEKETGKSASLETVKRNLKKIKV